MNRLHLRRKIAAIIAAGSIITSLTTVQFGILDNTRHIVLKAAPTVALKAPPFKTQNSELGLKAAPTVALKAQDSQLTLA